MFLYYRVPIFIDQFREVMDLMMKKWQSIPSDQGNDVAQCLIPEVRRKYFYELYSISYKIPRITVRSNILYQNV